MKYGFVTVAAAIPAVKVADTDFNIDEIIRHIKKADDEGAEIICFPELCLTGYSCQDLFNSQLLIEKAESALMQLLSLTHQLDIISIVGLPISVGHLLFNCAVVVQHGCVLGIVPKTYLPNYNEFYEKRWFASTKDLNTTEIFLAGSPITISPDPKVFVMPSGTKFAIEICEDVWTPTPPSTHLALAGADIIFNLSASDELIGKHNYLKSLLTQQSARTICGYVYSSCGYGESTQDVVYGGNAMVFENGRLLIEAKRFSYEPQLKISQIDVERLRSERRSSTTFANAQHGMTATYIKTRPVKDSHNFRLINDVNPLPFIPVGDAERVERCEEILSIQAAGLAKRLVHTHCKHVVIGISGGLDSTLALLVCIRTFDNLNLNRKGIIGVTMPGFGTTNRTRNNATELMSLLGVTLREISIVDSVCQHFKDIDHDPSIHDVTYENSQARERTQILMDIANQTNGLVVGTGDLSELALGWATYNGDHMSMYGVNAGIPKTLIRHLVHYAATTATFQCQRHILLDIIETPISPELTPADENGYIQQKTEDLVGPYELHDFFLYYFLRYRFRPSKIFALACKAFDGENKCVKAYDKETIKYWLHTFFRRFFSQQFKRSCLPDGPKVGSVSLSPRGDWRMPSDASPNIWLAECEQL